MRWLVVMMYVLMVGVNALANLLPINGITTGAVSDSYPNLFAPAGLTFSIWGVIYLALGAYVVYQLLLNWRLAGANYEMGQLGLWFSMSSVVNAAWIVAWHYNFISLTVVLMLALLLMLIRCRLIVEQLSSAKLNLRVVGLPFSLYLGWITVATIANVTTWLVQIQWQGFGILETYWTAAILLIGCAIGAATTFRFNDRAYAGVILWAYAGIVLKHVSSGGFGGEYPLVIAAACISIVIMTVFLFRPRLWLK